MHPQSRHGSVWFDVSGFGRVRRDFMVDAPEVLASDMSHHINNVARQIMLLDKTLPNNVMYCRPVKIDIVAGDVRRIFDYDTGRVLFEQQQA